MEDDSITYMGIDQFTRKWVRVHTHGGKLFENLCQAIARDVMAANMPLIEAAGYQIVLTVHDDGVGLPEHVDLQRAESLGLQVVTSLVEQLEGTVHIDRQMGSRYTITFPATREQVAEGAS